MGEKYLVLGAILNCTQGSIPTPLLVPGHDIVITDQPLANMLDCIKGTNIIPFGVCKVTGKPCDTCMDIIPPWFLPNSNQMVGGLPGITMKSFLVCAVGGLIQPSTCGQGMSKPQVQNLKELMEANMKHNPNTGAGDLEIDWPSYLLNPPDTKLSETTGQYAQMYTQWLADSKYIKENPNLSEDKEQEFYNRYYPLIQKQYSQLNDRQKELIFAAKNGDKVSGLAAGHENAGDESINKGVEMKYGVTSHEPNHKFRPDTPQYAIMQNKRTYVDANGNVRFSKITGVKDSTQDYYCMGVPRGVMKESEKYSQKPKNENNVNAGYMVNYTFKDDNGKETSIDVITVDAKASDDDGDFYSHNHIVEFVRDPDI